MTWLVLVGVVVQAVTSLVAIGSLTWAILQGRSARSMERSRIVADTLHRFSTDEGAQSAYRLIDYGRFKYDPGLFHGSTEEYNLDKLLRLFANVAYHVERGLVDIREVEILAYYAKRVAGNAEVRKYLAFVEQLAGNEAPSHPFMVYLAMVKRLNGRELPALTSGQP